MQGWFIIICGGLHADRGDPLVRSFPSVYACVGVCVRVCGDESLIVTVGPAAANVLLDWTHTQPRTPRHAHSHKA